MLLHTKQIFGPSRMCLHTLMHSSCEALVPPSTVSTVASLLLIAFVIFPQSLSTVLGIERTKFKDKKNPLKQLAQSTKDSYLNMVR